MLTLFVQRILRETPNPVVVELGACDGRYTNAMLFCCLIGKANIYAFEPDPRNIKVCRQTIPYTVHFIPAAAGNVTGKVSFHLASAQDNGEVGSSSISPFKDQSKAFPWCQCEGTIEVNSYRLDDFCAEQRVDYIDLLFMDVQGAERLVIEGAQRILKTTRYLWTEFEGVLLANEGTCYQHSSSLERLCTLLGPSWEVAEIAGGDALLVNLDCGAANVHTPVDLLYRPWRPVVTK